MPQASDRPLGLITAIPQELAEIGAHFQTRERQTHGGFAFLIGTLDGRDTVAVETGIGKVNAAMVATLLCELFGIRDLLFSGVAGGLDPNLAVGDVVIGRRLVMHDYGAVVDGRFKTYQPGMFPLPGQPEEHGYDLTPDRAATLEAALPTLAVPTLSAQATGAAVDRTPRIVLGTILTGDGFVNCEATRIDLHARFAAQAVEMEGAAIAQVAEKYGADLLVVRALSDLAGADSHMDFGAFVGEAARLAADLVRQLARIV